MRRMLLVLGPMVALLLTVLGPSTAATGAKKPVTITFWNGFTARELGIINSSLVGFHKKYPWITVKSTGALTADKLTAAIRGGNAPDAASLFETDSLGAFCSSGAFQDLNSYIKRDKLNMNLFPKTIRDYTAYQDKRCALPLLADAYGLYYNKTLFAKAGLKGPPKTVAQLATYAKKLTQRNKDGSLKVVGYNPLDGWYENAPVHTGPMWGVKWMKDGKSAIASDPGWAAWLRWQKSLIDWYGYKNLVKWQAGTGDEFSPSNAFEAGKVAMNLDGEYRTAFIKAEHPEMKYGTAPLPTSKPSLYGSGFVIGTIMAIPKGSDHPDEAWLLEKYLATNTKALTQLSLGLRNVPSTLPSLKIPALRKDPQFRVFLDIFANPKSSTQPVLKIGSQNQTTFATFVGKWQAGHVKPQDLHKGLQNVDKQIDDAIAQSGQVP
jgi:multiple sugar transport system substrate-binding protein